MLATFCLGCGFYSFLLSQLLSHTVNIWILIMYSIINSLVYVKIFTFRVCFVRSFKTYQLITKVSSFTRPAYVFTSVLNDYIIKTTLYVFLLISISKLEVFSWHVIWKNGPNLREKLVGIKYYYLTTFKTCTFIQALRLLYSILFNKSVYIKQK